jgi:branched-chain amino acid transport system substrate-binding protein
MEPFLETIIEPDINKYMAELGYGTTYTFVIDQADSQAAIHLEKVQSFKSMGLEVFIGGPWSSMAMASLSYVNENDMLMISTSSTSPLLAIAGDRLNRICPTDFVQAPALAEMLYTWGIEQVIVFQRADAWGDGIYNLFIEEWEDRGYGQLERVRYAAESTEYANYLSTMNDVIAANVAEYGYERIGVLTESFDELVVAVTQTADYPEVRKVMWFGCESSGRSQRMLDDAGGLQVELGIFSSFMAPGKSWKWTSLEDRYYDIAQTNAGFYTGCDYDGTWVSALTMQNVASDKATPVAGAFIETARNFYGATGWIDLDENGDRKPTTFDIWGFYQRGDELGFQKFGEYDGIAIEVAWYDDLLTEQGHVRPGPR